MSILHRKPRSQAPEPPPDLGHRAARGLLWMMSQTVGVKLVSLIANVVLAWFVAPGDAGLVGMAYTVLSVAGFIQYMGMQDVLVQRQAHFRRWITPAFWMTLSVGILGGSFVAMAAPLAAWFYGDERLIGLVLLLAIAAPLQTTSIVPQAMLSAQLRFRTSVVIGTVSAISISLMSILLAWLGFGPYSFLIPIPIMAAAQSAALWWFARPRIQWPPQLGRWKFLLGDTGYNWGISICLIVNTVADHIIVGRMFSKDVMGIYFWAVNLSTQLQRLLSTNLMAVLLPSLSKLQDHPARQVAAFLQATRVLAMAAIPGYLLQAALAKPIVRLLYKQAWEGVGPVLAVLSAGMAMYFVSGPATSMMKAQGRFRAAFLLYLCHALVMTTIVLIVAATSEESNAALRVGIAVAICLGIAGPVYLYMALHHSEHGWLAVTRVFAGPTTASVLAIGAAIGICQFLPDMAGRDALQIAITIVISGMLYPLLMRWIDAETWNIAVTRLKSLGPQARPVTDGPISLKPVADE